MRVRKVDRFHESVESESGYAFRLLDIRLSILKGRLDRLVGDCGQTILVLGESSSLLCGPSSGLDDTLDSLDEPSK